MQNKVGKLLAEGANVKAVRSLMIGLAAAVVLAVSGYGTVIYIQLMQKVFPDGPLLLACYMGAAANLLLMVVLLVGKFVWFRPGAHEVTSWIVTGVELAVAILNMMLAFELANGQQLSSLMLAWSYLAPVSPIFSMVGAILLIMTSTELRSRHQQMEMQDQKEQSERAFDLALHEAQMSVKTQYLGFIQAKLTQELNAPERQLEMADHAALLVSDVLSGISGVQSVPRLRTPQLPNERTIEQGQPSALPAPRPASAASLEASDEWLDRVNAQVEHARQQRLVREGATDTPTTQALPSEEVLRQQLVRALLPLVTEEEAQAKLLRVERMLGLGPSEGLSLPQRLDRLIQAAFKLGYRSDQVMELARRYLGPAAEVSGAEEQENAQGGDASKKK